MTDETVFQDFLGETVKAAFAEQERVIGTLKAGSHLLELPDYAKWLVIEPNEETKTLTLKAITADGRMVVLDRPFAGDWKAKLAERRDELLSSPLIRQESEAE